MKKNRIIFLLMACCPVITSCGSYTKTNNLTCFALNQKNKFTIHIPVYQLKEQYVYFKFQEGYSMDDLKKSLDESNDFYEYNDGDLFINTIIKNKSEYFIIQSPSESSDPYKFRSMSCLYRNSYGLSEGKFLIPYFLLSNKKDWINIDQFLSTNNEEITMSCDIVNNYEVAKLLYSQSDQNKITYDDTNKMITIYDNLYLKFSNSNLTLERKKLG